MILSNPTLELVTSDFQLYRNLFYLNRVKSLFI